MSAVLAFALATALHAGFQIAVTLLVYPVLGDRLPAEWRAAHARHSRTIAPLVLVVYGAVVVSGAAVVLSSPDPLAWLALAVTAGALAVTAFAAAPTHGRLTDRDDALVARLLAADRWRCVLAVAGAALAGAAVAVAQ